MLSAQTGNGVTVSNLAVNAGTVTFNVAWDRDAMPVTLWSDSVWVFVDYNKVGRMERLPITDVNVSAGRAEKIPGNDKGVWVIGNARRNGTFSATVQLLTTVNDVGGACAYASNYPPVGKYISATKISFTGTPMYKIVLEETAGGTTFTAYSDGSYTLPAGHTIQSFTDATGAPGISRKSTPTYAKSSQTWIFPGSTLTWSDAIHYTPICNGSSFTSSTTEPSCRSYTNGNTVLYYYNWPFVNKNAEILCDNGWHVPNKVELDALITSVTQSQLESIWGITGQAGQAQNNTTLVYIRIWTITSCNDNSSYDLGYYHQWKTGCDYVNAGFTVRCVK
jgi:hypothetical protein